MYNMHGRMIQSAMVIISNNFCCGYTNGSCRLSSILTYMYSTSNKLCVCMLAISYKCCFSSEQREQMCMPMDKHAQCFHVNLGTLLLDQVPSPLYVHACITHNIICI